MEMIVNALGAATISLDVQNSFETRPPMERNVVADLPGTQPNEMVLVGAHFDSWDLAQGANDNGSGVVALLEVARGEALCSGRVEAVVVAYGFDQESRALAARYGVRLVELCA
jgi:Zn-dependent M28 family amino/carboxypeptidase